jgi:2-keto-3-deoxy-L-rhamnonate aldolase RhmA
MIIDNEHGAFSPELMADVCAAGRLADLAVLMRPISHDMNTIRKSIDMGPCGLLLPNVNSAAVLDQVRDAIYMPPRGQRRPGGRGNRWVGDYSYHTWKTEVEDNLIILTTAMAIGPYDLSVDLGVAGKTSGPEITAATQTIQRAARAAGKKMWVIGDGPALMEQGFTFLCIAEPTGLLEGTLKQMVLGLQASGD